MRPDDGRICFCFSASRGGISLPRWKGWTSPGVGCVGCVGVGDAAAGSLLTSKKRQAVSWEEQAAEGQWRAVTAAAFPALRCPAWGAALAEEVDFLPEPSGRQEVRGPGPPVPDPRGAAMSGCSTGCGTWFPPRGPAQARGCRAGLSVGPAESALFTGLPLSSTPTPVGAVTCARSPPLSLTVRLMAMCPLAPQLPLRSRRAAS